MSRPGSLAAKHTASFVIRLWTEPREMDAPPEWRCYIRHVQSGDEAHLFRLSDLMAFIEQRAGVRPPWPGE